jgi:hypothetical protein
MTTNSVTHRLTVPTQAEWIVWDCVGRRKLVAPVKVP